MGRRKWLRWLGWSVLSAIATATMVHSCALLLGWDFLPLLYGIPIGLAMVTLLLASPVALVSLLLLPVAQVKRWNIAQLICSELTFYLALGLHTTASLATSQSITHWQHQKARAFAEALIPQLETYQDQRGQYPETWPLPAAQLPHFVDADYFYSSNGGQDYSFIYSNPWSFGFTTYRYDSDQGQWQTETLD